MDTLLSTALTFTNEPSYFQLELSQQQEAFLLLF